MADPISRTKNRPLYDNNPKSFLGKTIMEIVIDFKTDVTAKTGVNSTIPTVLKTINKIATIVMTDSIPTASGAAGRNTVLRVFVEGEFPSDKYDGTNAETLAVFLQSEVRALGTIDGFDLNPTSNAPTVTAGKTFNNE